MMALILVRNKQTFEYIAIIYIKLINTYCILTFLNITSFNEEQLPTGPPSGTTHRTLPYGMDNALTHELTLHPTATVSPEVIRCAPAPYHLLAAWSLRQNWKGDHPSLSARMATLTCIGAGSSLINHVFYEVYMNIFYTRKKGNDHLWTDLLNI